MAERRKYRASRTPESFLERRITSWFGHSSPSRRLDCMVVSSAQVTENRYGPMTTFHGKTGSPGMAAKGLDAIAAARTQLASEQRGLLRAIAHSIKKGLGNSLAEGANLQGAYCLGY